MDALLRKLQDLAIAPTSDSDFDTWLSFADAVEFLRDNASGEELVLYAGYDHFYLHAVAVPERRVRNPDTDDLLRWQFGAYDQSWAVSDQRSRPLSITAPLDHTDSKTIDGGQKLVFPRSFEGLVGDKFYVELLQELVHILGIHWTPERGAYCYLNEDGDVEDVVRVAVLDAQPGGSRGHAVVTRRAAIDYWLALKRMALIQTFDIVRKRPGRIAALSGEAAVVRERDLIYRGRTLPHQAGYIRGVQIVRPLSTLRSLRKRSPWPPRSDTPREYVSFIAHDFKNGLIAQVSTKPGATANYFTDSQLPFEMSPAFFQPAVLQRYKADPDKYRLEERSISCRGSWSLETYDINSAGQVHTYICYLARLTYREQLHWKAHNEAPRDSLSERAIRTDFEGRWDLPYDALANVRRLLAEWSHQQVPWWRMKDPNAAHKVHYPATTSADEWGRELHALHQFIIEGFESGWLRRTAASLGRRPDDRVASLKLLEECLLGLKCDAERAAEIVAPLRNLNELRSKIAGHSQGTTANEIRRRVLKEHKTFRMHFEKLCAQCDSSLKAIGTILGSAPDELSIPDR